MTRAVPTIVYLHGFRSSPASIKATKLVRAVGSLPDERRPRLHVPFLRNGPASAIEEVAAWIESNAGAVNLLTLVGSSLGGYYATYLAERFGARAVLINPAIRPYEDLRPYVGRQTNLYTGETFEVTSAHFDELRALSVSRITRPERYLLLVQSGDEVLDWREAVAFYGGAFQYVESGGDHGYHRFESQIPTILRFAGVDVPARNP
jgi:predicted esterase YcpF (UPF0227 family)